MPIAFSKLNFKSQYFSLIQRQSNKISGITLILIGILIFSERMYVLASLFQDLFIFLHIGWLSTI